MIRLHSTVNALNVSIMAEWPLHCALAPKLIEHFCFRCEMTLRFSKVSFVANFFKSQEKCQAAVDQGAKGQWARTGRKPQATCRFTANKSISHLSPNENPQHKKCSI